MLGLRRIWAQEKGGGKGPYKGGKGGYEGKGKGGKGGYGKAGKGGTGKGTGVFTGECHQCGIIGHSKQYCPSLGEGFKGTCYTCGLVGHSSARCPKGKGKGDIKEVEWEEEGNKEEQGNGESIGALRFGGGLNTMKRGTMTKNKYQSLEEEWVNEMDMGNILGVGEEEIPELVFSDSENEYMVQNKTNGNLVKVMKKKATRKYRKAVS